VAQARLAFELIASRWGAPAEVVDGAYTDLATRYSEPHRHYHTLEHIEEVLTVVDRLGGGIEVQFAAWFHDAIYDTSYSDSEERSAAYGADVLARLGAPAAVIAEVKRLVRLTAAHVADPADVNGAILTRADLSILSSDAARYDRYAHDARAEYAHVSDDAWREGRAVVLRSLLATTDDAAARSNVARELASLSMA
jgi:predicted metal-dependent HD superfamily phosphohydrolase